MTLKKQSSKAIIFILAFVCLFYALSTWINVESVLRGNFNYFFLPAKMFGIPKNLEAHGITELYTGKNETGWDGQFYYYVSNDPLGITDTAQHIDAPSYRYQRIGLPVLAYLASKITGQAWVSPLTYYLTNFLIILLATFYGARFFLKNDLSPYLILMWTCSFGTLITQLSGLTDGAADGLLILALTSLLGSDFKSNLPAKIAFTLTMSLSCLSREGYVLIPVVIGIIVFFGEWANRSWKIGTFIQDSFDWLPRLIPFIIPVILMLSWQMFLIWKFGKSPSSEAINILGLPFFSAWEYLKLGLSGHNPNIGSGYLTYLESGGILLFCLFLLWTAIALIFLIFERKSALYIGVGSAFLLIVLLYFCFGSTVMMHHTGFLKTLSIFFFLQPCISALRNRKFNNLSICFLILLDFYFNFFLYGRIIGHMA